MKSRRTFLRYAASFLSGSTFFLSSACGQGVINKSTPDFQDVPAAPTSVVKLNELIIQLAPGVNQSAFAQQQGLSLIYTSPSDSSTYLFKPTNGSSVTPYLTSLGSDPRVSYLAQNGQTQRIKNSFTPNDPLYFTSGGFNGQWHLNNTLSRPQATLTAAGAWASNTPGQGVIIGDVDDGIEPTHPDISANFNATHTFDFIANSATQTFDPLDAHGMSTSGVAAARGGNGIGVTGSAPFAQIASMKVFTGNTVGTDIQFRDAVLYHSSGSNTSVTIKNHSYGIGSPFIDNSVENSGYTTSAAAGTVHVLSAGNDRGTSGQDANKKMAQANPNVITVAAIGANNIVTTYSNFGANVFVTAPSNRIDVAAAGNSISTTDRVGANGYNTNGASNYADLDYTNDFGGTSSSAPLVTGIMALGKQANPSMEVRLAKHILVRTSTVVNPTDATTQSDGGWKTNAAGFRFNQNYGFGLINGDAFVNMVSQFQVTPLVTAASGTQTVTGGAIPDNNLTGITRTYVNPTAGLLEEVIVNMNVTHTFRGDLTAFLTSPSGYVSRLFIQSGSDSTANLNWNFTDNAFWGEQAQGTWSIRVADAFSGDTGTWNSFSLTFLMGTITAIPEPATVAFCALATLGTAGVFWRRRRLHRQLMDQQVTTQRS